jgi:hypothetical protein
VALAVLLAIWADRVAGAWLLILFLTGVSLWITANELPTWFGPGAATAALYLLCTAPLASAIFFNFAATFSRFRLAKWIMWGICVVAAAAGLATASLGPGSFQLVPLAYPALSARSA